MLIHTHLREQTVKFIAQLEIITIDIVSSLVSEVNIHECDLEDIADILNVVKNPFKYDILQINKTGKEKETVVKYNVTLNQLPEDYGVGDYIGNGSRWFGQILEIPEDNVFVIDPHPGHGLKFVGKAKESVTIRVEPVPNYHGSFGDNAF